MQKEWKHKTPTKLFVQFWVWLQKAIDPKKIWSDKGADFAGEYKKLCKAEGIKIYSTMSETKAVFAQRTIGSLKNILYRCMKTNGYKYMHRLTQFVITLNSRRNFSIDLIPKNVKHSNILSILYSKPLREFGKPKFKLEGEFAFRNMTNPSGRVISHSLHKRFSELLQLLPKNLQHTQWRMNKMRLSAVNFKIIYHLTKE